MVLEKTAPVKASAHDPIRVMVVDDSAVIRGFLTRFIESDPNIKVIKTSPNGQLALRELDNNSFDVIVLDIEMPVMDGLTALPLILKADPNVQVIIASTLTKENANITLKAFKIGAAECLAKPTSHELAGSNIFRDSLVEKIKALGEVARKKRSIMGIAPKKSSVGTARISAPIPFIEKKFDLRREMLRRPRIVAIGSSTGGPQALMTFFKDIPDGITQPIFVTQHMPPTFTAILAEHISKQSGLDCAEGKEGEVVKNGKIYLAPGDYHMTVKKKGIDVVISLNQEPQESFCRPAVDPMLRSLIEVYGKDILALIFTGMGADGLKGCQQLVEKGGTILAQDEATSVVWGMPGAVAMDGICTKVLPLGLLPNELKRYANFGGKR